MAEEVYQELCKTMARRGGMYPGMDIPEFYELAQELFTADQAAVANAMPRGFSPASTIAAEMGRSEEEVATILEEMANKGLCSAAKKGEMTAYGGPPFVPGIFEFQFMRGTSTGRDKKLAKLIHNYKTAVSAARAPVEELYPTMRVITVDRVIKAGNQIHTYDQVASYIDKYEPLAVSTCYCRHQATLMDDGDYCGKPTEVCMQFGMGAQFVIDRGMGKKVSKEDALEILRQSEEAGLVHCSTNRQEIDFLCNCCSCHCLILKQALSHPKPGLAVSSGFQPIWDAEECTACENCIERCPMEALAMGEDEVPEVDLDRCIGCGVCATGCPSKAVELEERPGIPVPPIDHKALKAAIKGSQARA
ncbi:MAG: 4Fe-4S binding protein [Desulfobacteraceae bacterium]|nr:MAG: 4Fe-4S binding protein [Desulfobacteraceae bacterium]